MNRLIKSALLPAAAVVFAAFSGSDNKKTSIQHPSITTAPAPKIQVAVLLDVSNSMDGLITQAKSQLWNMVNILGRAKCDGGAAQIEIALYEYGRTSNDQQQGYVKQINPFTKDLDEVSKNLFSLTTNGGEEYCGNVIYTSVKDLQWDTASANYKVIFIAGNESFRQGNISFTKACAEAKKKGVIVNTIYCGNRRDGISEFWNLGAECGSGSFTNINQDAREEDIPTPYDSVLFVLNEKLNGTYIGYGHVGAANVAKQQSVDKMNAGVSRKTAVKRISVKSKGNLYNNATWDMVDAQTADTSFVAKVDMQTLPDSLRTKSRTELKQIITVKQKERSSVQKEIEANHLLREKFLAQERTKNKTVTVQPTLETEIERIIKEQVKRYRMTIE